MSSPSPELRPLGPPPSSFRERLGTYALGVALGLVLVGALLSGRQRSRQPDPATTGAPATPGTPPAPAPAP